VTLLTIGRVRCGVYDQLRSADKKVLDVAEMCNVEVINRTRLLELLTQTDVTYKDVLTRLDKQRIAI
jgi:hypothetical protein